MRPRPSLTAALLVATTLVLAACGSDGPASRAASSDVTAIDASDAGSDVTGDITVFAAASLSGAFTDIGAAFEAEHPDAHVTFNFAASSELATQIDQGAPADVYASADVANMTALTDAGGASGAPRVFATNALQIIVQPGNPLAITGLADLGGDGIVYVTCAPEVPIGRYAAQVLERAGVEVRPASLEQSVKGIVTKVTLGEADAGIVYRTDVAAAGADAQGVDIPPDENVVASYPIVEVADAPNSHGAAAFIDFVLGSEGQQILGRAGFGAPS